MNWKTNFTELTGSKFPIIMGAFAYIGNGSFAAAFSNTGGFGIITASNFNPDQFKAEIKMAKSLTKNPFGINFSIVPPELNRKDPKLRGEDYYIENDFVKIARGYRVKGIKVTKPSELKQAVKTILASKGPVLADFWVEEEENVFPMVPAGAAINRMIGGMA